MRGRGVTRVVWYGYPAQFPLSLCMPLVAFHPHQPLQGAEPSTLLCNGGNNVGIARKHLAFFVGPLVGLRLRRLRFWKRETACMLQPRPAVPQRLHLPRPCYATHAGSDRQHQRLYAASCSLARSSMHIRATTARTTIPLLPFFCLCTREAAERQMVAYGLQFFLPTLPRSGA